MKILLVDNVTDGHHLIYARTLADTTAYECVAALPAGEGSLSPAEETVSPAVRGKEEGLAGGMPCVFYPPEDLNGYRFGSYFRFLKHIRKIAAAEKPDVIHFLNADVLVNYIGLGMGWLKGYRTLFTFHHFFGGLRKTLSLRLLLRRASGAVVHTASLQKKFSAYGGRVFHVEYPDFLWPSAQSSSELALSDSESALSDPAPRTLLALGQTRRDKGLDLLLEALGEVTAPFRLIVAGAPCDFDEDYIRRASRSYAERVTLDLKYLSEGEMTDYLRQADVVVLPYRKSFDGASGPLTEGVGLYKCIVGPSSGSLGEIIRENHLGYTFAAEDVSALREALTRALTEDFFYDERALAYRERLSPARFGADYWEVYQSLCQT